MNFKNKKSIPNPYQLIKRRLASRHQKTAGAYLAERMSSSTLSGSTDHERQHTAGAITTNAMEHKKQAKAPLAVQDDLLSKRLKKWLNQHFLKTGAENQKVISNMTKC